jgi:hypothetical protein
LGELGIGAWLQAPSMNAKAGIATRRDIIFRALLLDSDNAPGQFLKPV